VQIKESENKLKELEEIALEPFARTYDDPKLEAVRKNEIRDGDPMAAYFQNKKVEDDGKSKSNKSRVSGDKEQANIKSRKPLYKGPLPPPNRFKIMPGYRWDAVDRGNHFEHKLLVKASEKVSYREDEYRYLASDL
jgi:pre-mRNA-splicing factor CWC26